ncbi:MAG: efflux RND transporter periplasmic adaptor subunit [Planctomycetes bacterium]|nr:efflux RND transporter periplasmic adaptor subunit [Planctomycetota bacterium]
MPETKRLAKLIHGFGRLAVALSFIVGTTVLLLWLAGKFSPKVADGPREKTANESPRGSVVAAQVLRFPAIEPAAGTVRAVHETSVGSKLMARVVKVNLKAGQQVKSGDLLVRLDDTELKARLEQAQAALTAAEAQRAQAIIDEKRYAGLLKSNAVSRQEYEKTRTVLRSLEAEVRRAQEVINELQATLEWAAIRAPMDGTVIDKKVDVGDLVSPGQILVTLYDPRRMQLVATVREGLAERLAVGQDITVEIDGLHKSCVGSVSEIVPEAQAASRTFLVKVTGPCPPGMYSGMFGRILIPLDEEDVLVVPHRAVREVGQLELVDVVDGDQVRRRAIRSGRTFGENVEILSGLRAGESVVLPEDGPGAVSGDQP